MSPADALKFSETPRAGVGRLNGRKSLASRTAGADIGRSRGRATLIAYIHGHLYADSVFEPVEIVRTATYTRNLKRLRKLGAADVDVLAMENAIAANPEAGAGAPVGCARSGLGSASPARAAVAGRSIT